MAQIEGRIVPDLTEANGHGPTFLRRWSGAARFYLETFERLAAPPFDTQQGQVGVTMPPLHVLRHALEIHLKTAALAIDLLVWSAANQIAPNPQILSVLPDTRNLQELAAVLTSRWPDVLGAEVEKLIDQLHAIDPTGDAFLYPATRYFSAIHTAALDVDTTAPLIETGRLAIPAIQGIQQRVLEKLQPTPA